MKTKRILCFTIGLAAVLLAAFVIPTIAQTATHDTQVVMQSELDGIVLRDKVATAAEIDTFGYVEAVKSIRALMGTSEEKLKQLKNLEADKSARFERSHNELENGNVAERITLSEVKEIIANNNEYDEIVRQLCEANNGADVLFGSGIDYREIWLSDDGSEKLLMGLGQINYGSLTENCRLY